MDKCIQNRNPKKERVQEDEFGFVTEEDEDEEVKDTNGEVKEDLKQQDSDEIDPDEIQDKIEQLESIMKSNEKSVKSRSYNKPSLLKEAKEAVGVDDQF